jgi:peroxiredoxin
MKHVQVGTAAPDFQLAPGPVPDRVSLSELRGEVVVLLFVPLAFSGVCTAEFCQVRDDWSQWEAVGARVLGISVDSPFVVKRWAADLQVPFTLLSDFNKEAASAYGVLYEDYFGMKGVPKRSAFVIDTEGVVRYAWVDESSDVIPPFDEIIESVRGLAETA